MVCTQELLSIIRFIRSREDPGLHMDCRETVSYRRTVTQEVTSFGDVCT